MPNNKLILRSVNSPWVTPFNDITTGSVLSWADVDNNFIYLKGEIIHTGYTSGNTLILEKINGKTIDLELEQFGSEGNRWYVPANEVVEVPSDYQSFIYGDLYLEGLVKLNDNSQLVVLNGDIIMNGGTISGDGTTLLVDLPTFDTKLVNGYFDSGILTLVDNAGGIITVSGISSTDIYLTGGTYNNGNFEFFNNTGGSFNILSTTSYSAGVISGSTGWSSTGSGQINLPDLKVALFDNPNNIEPIVTYDVQSGVSGSGGIDPLTDNDTNYIVINYNNGTPIYEVLNNLGTVNHSDIILYLIVYRLGNFIHVLEFGNDGAGLPNKLNDRLLSTDRFARESGLSLGLSASTGVVLISSGVAWNGPYRQSLVGVNSQDDIFFQNYHSGGTWVYSTSADTINNSFYDDGTDIVSGTPGNYLVNWYYRGQEVDDHIYEVWGNNEYVSVLDAEASSEPVLPELITSHAFLVGRIIIGVGETTGITQTAFGTVFQPSGYASGFHNDLLNIQGGAPGEYYHLSSSEYNNLSLSTTGATLDDDTIYFDTFGSLSAYTITLPNLGFTGNTSASCINDLWVTNIHGCSPVNIQDDLIVNGSVSADEYNGNIILNESTLTTFNGNILKTGTGTTVQGDVYYLNSSNGWSLANANSIVTSDGLLGIAVGTDPSVDGMLINGLAKNISYTGTTGSPLYLSDSDGNITEYPPSGVGYIIRIVGYKLGSSGSILFNPDPTWIELS